MKPLSISNVVTFSQAKKFVSKNTLHEAEPSRTKLKSTSERSKVKFGFKPTPQKEISGQWNPKSPPRLER